mmetsp:Transcript_68130/g.154170  ORF Transcript_68130/g.154170 Transcript_68130/m.154170 type:complete len:387 (-) Transcript_68130:205-1365(-)
MASSSQPSQCERWADGPPDKEDELCPSRGAAKSIVDSILQLQEAHEGELLVCKNRIKELEAQAVSLKQRNRELEEGTPGTRTRRRSADDGADRAKHLLGISSESIFLEEKGQFIKFVLAVANGGKDSKEYKHLYHFLLKCFTDADNNFDGRLGYLEFETLIDAAAFLPRRFGYAPSTPELYSSDFDRVKQRLALFNGLKPKKAWNINKQGSQYDYISFNMWLHYAMTHIREKAVLLKDESPRSKLEGTRDVVQEFLAACQNRKSREYKEFYHVVLKCFVDSDKDMDGLIDMKSFYDLLEVMIGIPGIRALVPTADDKVSSGEHLWKVPQNIFRGLQHEFPGYITFDIWLDFMFTQLTEKVTPGSPTIQTADGTAAPAKSTGCPFHM